VGLAIRKAHLQATGMSRIFLSHSSRDNDSAVALRDWLAAQGWDDVFLDLDPQRGIAAGDRWERALNQCLISFEKSFQTKPAAVCVMGGYGTTAYGGEFNRAQRF
jgi:hypothetical protein